MPNMPFAKALSAALLLVTFASPTAFAAAPGLEDYRIQPEDVIEIYVWREAEPYADFAPIPYTAQHEALIRQIVVEAGVDSESDAFGVIRWGLEGGGVTLVLDRVSPRLDSLRLRLINLGR